MSFLYIFAVHLCKEAFNINVCSSYILFCFGCYHLQRTIRRKKTNNRLCNNCFQGILVAIATRNPFFSPGHEENCGKIT